MKSLFLIISYFIATVLFLILLNFFPEKFILGLIVKSLIIPFLFVYYILNVKKDFKRSNYVMLVALLFSCIGDVAMFISKNNELFFLIGLVGFLITHILYILVFFDVPKKYSIIKKKLFLLIPFLIFEIVLLIILYNSLGVMKIPAIIYSIVILLMAVIALNRYKNVGNISFYLVFIGALLFVLSDTIISINVFKSKILFAEELIMTTYVIAQFLIVRGHVKQRLDNI